MKIRDVICIVGRSGFFNRDLKAMKAGAEPDGFTFKGPPMTPGFKRIVQPGGEISIMLRLEDGQIALGDCMDVNLSGAAGRDPLFQPEEHLPFLRGPLLERLRGREVGEFRPLAEEIDALSHNGRRLHTALRYGITQALLHAAALAHHEPMAATIAREYGSTPATEPVPILASAGTKDGSALDRVILKKAELLPHASFNHVERDIGLQGEKLIAFATRVARRIAEIGEPGYRPTMHLDVYGTLGELFQNDVERIAAYMGKVKEAVGNLDLMIESPIIMPTRAEQVAIYHALCQTVKRQGLAVQVIVDEWCNTLDDVRAFTDAQSGDLLQVKTPDLGGVNNAIEAVLYARRKGMGVSLGGSVNETDQSTRVTAHIALACRPTYIYAKPGSGADLGMMIESNEMIRTLALLQRA